MVQVQRSGHDAVHRCVFPSSAFRSPLQSEQQCNINGSARGTTPQQRCCCFITHSATRSMEGVWMGSGWQESDVKSGTVLELLCAPSGASHCSFWSTRCLFRFDFIRPSLSVVHHAGDKKHSRMGRSTHATTNTIRTSRDGLSDQKCCLSISSTLTHYYFQWERRVTGMKRANTSLGMNMRPQMIFAFVQLAGKRRCFA